MEKRVAIISYAFRFPGTNTQTFWNDLIAKRILLSRVEASRWSQEAYLHPDKRHPGSSYTFAAGSLGDISGFDTGFFGISPREASHMDPQQKMLLEMAWETFENAGIVPSALKGSDCGVYVGISSVDGAYRLADDLAALESASATGNLPSIAANRISYVYDFRGPSVAVDTACSSALVAFHQACQAIRSGEISQALAGGINLHLHPYGFISFSKATMLLKTGRCHVFDASADGYVRSEGGGLFLLKDYQQAIADGDQILALVAGSMVNTDGHKSGLTIPSADVQAELLDRVYKKASIDPNNIDYIEAHGTGTPVGDPIEAYAIGLGVAQKRKTPLPIGSVKSNLGHLESASGVAGLVKALNCMKHRTVPATAGIQKLNPKIRCDEWNITIPTETLTLKQHGRLVIGVNSFGFGGANAHVVLESPERAVHTSKNTVVRLDRNPLPLVVSAKDNNGLLQAADEMAQFLENTQENAYYDVAYSTFFYRERHSQGALFFSNSPKDAAEQLKLFAQQEAEQETSFAAGAKLAKPKGPVFVYSGNGCQWEKMGKLLLEQSQTFRRVVVEIDRLFSKYATFSLLDELSGLNGESRYKDTEIAQPALFALQVGVTEVLRENGIQPLAVVGHSVGEVAAAWASGILSLPTAVKVIYYRSHHQGRTKGSGQMTAVGLGQQEIEAVFSEVKADELCVAGINSFRGVTVAGQAEQLSILETELRGQNVFYKRLDLDYAFHSQAMDTIKLGLVADLGQLSLNHMKIPFYSTVTGSLIRGDKLDAEYWWQNIRQPVLFQHALNAIIDNGFNMFIEIGAHPVLRAYLQDCLKENTVEGAVIPTVLRNKDSLTHLMKSVALTLLSGVEVDKKRWFPVNGQFVKLPNYPWQKENFNQPITTESYGLMAREKIHPLLGYALKQQESTWENQLDTQLLPYLADHNVGGAVVFPGAGFVEIALAAAHQLNLAHDFIEIEDLEIHMPLLLSDDHTKVIRAEILNSGGQFNLRSRALANGQDWTQHIVGRIVPAPTGNHLNVTMPTLPRRKPDFDLKSHTELTEWTGLQYGANFKTISHGWSDSSSAIGVFAIPETITEAKGHYYLHPGLLDCAFQLIFQVLKSEVFKYDGIAFVPTKFGRIFLRTDKTLPFLAQAKLVKRSPHSINTEFTLFDHEGIAVAHFTDVRFRAVRLHKHSTQNPDYLDYHLTPAPTSRLMAQAISKGVPSQLHGLLTKALKNSQKPLFDGRYSNEVEPLLDSLCLQYVAEALGKFCDVNGFLKKNCFNDLGLFDFEMAKSLRNTIDIAVKNQLLIKFEEKGWQLNTNLFEKDLSAQEIWRALVQEYPDYFYLINLAGRAGIHLEEILKGGLKTEQIDLTPKLYDRISFQIFEQTCRKTLTSLIQSYCEQTISRLTSGERLSILEVSSYKPIFAASLCINLDFKLSDYRYASFCDEAFNHAELLREHYPLLQTCKLTPNDAETGPIRQNKCSNLAIISLNSVSLKDLKTMLSDLPKMLVPGSPIILAGQHPAQWLDIVLGTSKAWWLEGEDNQLISPQLTAQQVEDQLQSLGFSDTHILESDAGAYSGIYVITANVGAAEVLSESKSHSENWLLVGSNTRDELTLAEGLASRLRDKGHKTHIQKFGKESTIADELAKAKACGEHYHHIVHLCGWGSDTIETQSLRCTIAAEMAQGCELTQTNATLWLVTHQVGTHFSSDQENAFISEKLKPSIANDAALWGFGRTLMNEATNYRVRLIDMSVKIPDTKVMDAIVDEFFQNDNEAEVILNSDGKRFVPRLRFENDPQKVEVSVESPVRRLGFKLPGQLRNLSWEPVPAYQIAEDEVEVEVKATGLNFRDVMYTLGLLSDEAVENGFVGPTLGLEFAGSIVGVGKLVKNFNVGDRVVGFGSASFSNRVRSKADAIAIIPSIIDFNAAATIPSTFFTAYYALVVQARMQPKEKILIHGAAGGVGIAAVQIAQWLGAEIYATAGSGEKRDFLRLMGIEHIHDSRTLSYAEEILAKTGNVGVDVVLNSLAGEAINRNFQVLKPFGRFLELGKRDFYENTHIGLRPFRNNISYFGIDADQLMLERPNLTKQLFTEMMKLFQEGVLHPLPYTVFDANQVVDAFRHMQQAKQIGKIVVTYDNGIKTKPVFEKINRPSLVLSADASYLVTGGLGGFGLRTAQWLVEKGAKNLILLSRSGSVTDESQLVLEALEKQSVRVYAKSCDVTDKIALKAVLDNTKYTMPPLKGIIHAATVIDDALVRNTTPEQIERVLAPKMKGAMNLHELTADYQLDYFILYSSATTLFGNPGQSSYVAANLWLEALAAFRRNAGLPATCIRWGAIGDTGYLARNEKIKDALQSRMGGELLDSATALKIMEQMMLSDTPTLGVMELDWNALGRFLPTANADKYREIALQNQDSDQNTDSSADIQRLLDELTDVELKVTFIDMLKQELAKILLLPVDKIDANQSVYDMGMDSLMGVELMVAIESRFGIQIPVMALSEASTLNKLVDKLIVQLRGDSEVSESSTTAIAVNDLAKLHGFDATSEQLAEFTQQFEHENSPNRIVH
ncbi:MAG: SDR family NAD(P)-dependent oxidoreductase [Methylococcaceae bacterium]|nr:SDR family NAD(P)-dependent oxidoreductase [Methylococcaceae bacterium]